LQYFYAFITGGTICALSQILIDKTRLTPARILTSYVVLGVILTAIGVYEPFKQWAGAGATVPLLGFGCTLAEGVRAAAGGISAAVFFGLCTAILFQPADKS